MRSLWSIASGIVLLLCWTGEVWAGQHVFIGRRLDTALLLLQRDRLLIVFGSEIVTPILHAHCISFHHGVLGLLIRCC